MQTISTYQTALLALQELDQGWIRSRNGNFYMPVKTGQLSIIRRNLASGWVWGYNYFSDPDNKPALRKYAGEYETALEAAISAREWLSIPR